MDKINKSYIFRILRFILFGLVAALVAGFIIEFFHVGLDRKLITVFIFESRTEIFKLSVQIFFFVYIGLSALSGSSIIGSFLTVFISLALGAANFLKYTYRNEYLFPSELSMITELPFLIDMITLREFVFFGGLFFIIIGTMVLIYQKFSLKRRKILSKKLHYSWRITLVIVSAIILVHVYRFNQPGNRIKAAFNETADWVTYNQKRNYENNGFVAGFLFNFGSEYMDKPDDYSRESVLAILDEYTEKAEQINKERAHAAIDANIIFLMNESFSDPSRIEGFEMSDDPIPFTRELMDNTLSGHSLSQSIGGGTANSEFEALTGMALEPFAGHVYAPYVEATNIMQHMPSIIQRTNDDRLNTTALHSNYAHLYKRTNVYENFGFDKFIHRKIMNYKEQLGNSDYISDAASYKELIDRMEETDGKDFIHLVTMQNHMSYRDKYDNPDFETSGLNNDDEGDGYLQDLNHSDEALKDLIAYIDQHDEETLLVFWGDHLPSIYPDSILDQNSRLTMRQTPLFFYSNQADLEGNLGTISPIYYINHVLDILDVKVTPFEALLMSLEEEVPGLYGGLYLQDGSDQTFETRADLNDQAQALLEKFNMIQYDIVSGDRYTKDLGFFELNQ